MWRKCDFHRHTVPDAGGDDFAFDSAAFLRDCVDEGLDVVAVTDHDRTDHINAVLQEASNHDVIVVPGVEMSTDRGHILALAPGVEGTRILNELRNRVPLRDGQADFSQLVGALGEQRVNDAGVFRNHMILIGAHVDQPRSLLGPDQSRSANDQVSAAQQLQGLEVVKHENLKGWRGGIKQGNAVMALLRGSDAHPKVEYESRSTWLYLPEISTQSLRHALATHEASICHDSEPPPEPEFWIRAIRFEGGPYDGRRIEFSPRANALIGPPSSGKSLVIDAIRHAFDIPCEIDDVRASIERRLKKCLPEGTTVSVEIQSGGGQRELRRIRGGTTVPVIDSKPIVFSQTELARRSMEPTPSVKLLDIHCPEGEPYKHEIQDVSEGAASSFTEIVDLAGQARGLRLEVENEQEGLEATRERYFGLVGDEETAKSLGDLGRIETWHKVAEERLSGWLEAFKVPSGPELPSVPQLETDLTVSEYVPTDITQEALGEYQDTIRATALKLADTLRKESKKRSPGVESLRESVEAVLGSGEGATAEVAEEAEQYRARLSELERQAQELAGLDETIVERLKAMDSLIDQASDARVNLRKARQAACTAVNRSMASFFVRLDRDKATAVVDALLNELRVGTHLHEGSVQAARDSLDRKAFVRVAIKHMQFPTPVEDREALTDASQDAGRIARLAMDRERHSAIVKLAVTWPDDGIEIFHNGQGGAEPVPFDDLSEGLKALAIKEISFAASHLPAVTDQPEDAVPTTAVFENLVPTVREQRVSRQFIIASHDANVVVSGDMERVIVLPPNPSDEPVVGTLFDKSIRDSAMKLLEGGDRAFELRRRRYGDYE